MESVGVLCIYLVAKYINASTIALASSHLAIHLLIPTVHIALTALALHSVCQAQLSSGRPTRQKGRQFMARTNMAAALKIMTSVVLAIHVVCGLAVDSRSAEMLECIHLLTLPIPTIVDSFLYTSLTPKFWSHFSKSGLLRNVPENI